MEASVDQLSGLLDFAEGLIKDAKKDVLTIDDNRVALFAKHRGINADDTLATLRSGAKSIDRVRAQVRQVYHVIKSF